MKRIRQLWVLVLILTLLFLYMNHYHLLQKQQPGLSAPASTPTALLTLPNAIALRDGNLTFYLNPRVYYSFFPHLQRYQCRELISKDTLCQDPPGPAAPLLLLAIKSHPASSHRRATLRHTWAKPVHVQGFRLQPVFLMASTSDIRHTHLVREENRVFADILMWDFEESHHNLSLKERCFLQWAHEHCQQATYVFKGDDDILVNVEAVTRFLRQTPKASNFIHGNMQNYPMVMRKGKYGMSRAFYPMDKYPRFVSGGGFVMPRSSLLKLYRVSLWLPVFPLDDVYLGFLTLAARLSYRHDRCFRVWGPPPRDDLVMYQESLMVHGLSMEKIEQVWGELHQAGQGKASHEPSAAEGEVA